MISVRRRQGFTLVELTIVLVVAGILFAGLWRLMSGGNAQMSASATAAQQVQMINAVKAFAASSNGQSWMTLFGPNQTANLPIQNISHPPDGTGTGVNSNIACKNDIGGTANPAAFICDFLPLGWTFSNSTNPYSQNYYVWATRDSTPAGSPPHSYSILIVTQGGTIIPDAQGGTISSQIGGDGGFLYTNNVCGTPSSVIACGAYGAWSFNYGTYTGWGANNGHVVSRSYVTPDAEANQPWLARSLIPGDTALPGANTYNTMQTPLALKTGSGGAATLYMNGGQITSATGGDTSSIFLKGTGGAGNPLISLNTACPGGGQSSPGNTGCAYGLQIYGDAAISNYLQVGKTLYANSDVRLKTNIETVRAPLDAIMRINPVSFNYKAGGQKSLGVIAQELAQVYPELVTTGPGMLAVNYQGLIAPLIGAVQELKHQNDELRTQLQEQAAREDRLEHELHRHAAQP